MAIVAVPPGRSDATYSGYQGRFDLFDDRVVHHIEMSCDPTLVGTNQTRYMKYDGATLTLTSNPSLFAGEGTSGNLIWRRVTGA